MLRRRGVCDATSSKNRLRWRLAPRHERGAGRRPIFDGDNERERFLGCLIAAGERYGVEVHAYCLLGNHYHLLLRSRSGQLSGTMSWLSSRYTQSLNYDKSRDGPIFRGRFASVLIGDDAHLLQASRYIHLNPVTAGLVAKPDLWPWSSAAAYTGHRAPPPWLAMRATLQLLGPAEPVIRYREFLGDSVDLAAMKRYEKLMAAHGVRPAGSDPGGTDV